MNSHRSSNGDVSWPISPAFRSGPRKGHVDHEAEEFIRFVRECQHHDVNRVGASRVKRKPVLPAIRANARFSQTDDCSSSGNRCHNILASDVNIDVTDVVNGVYRDDFNFVEKNYDTGHNFSEDEDQSSDELCTENDDVLIREIVCENVIKNDFGAKNEEILEKLTLKKSRNHESVLPSSRLIRPFSNIDNLTHNSNKTTADIDSYFNTSSTRSHFSSVSTSTQLQIPRVLPQLPPITRNAIPLRPPAPSPTSSSPSPISIFDNDYMIDFNDNTDQ